MLCIIYFAKTEKKSLLNPSTYFSFYKAYDKTSYRNFVEIYDKYPENPC